MICCTAKSPTSTACRTSPKIPIRQSRLAKSYADGHTGATASVIAPWYLERYAETDDFRPLGWWIADNVEHFAEAFFFPWLCAFNIRWYEGPSDKAIEYDAPEQREDIVLTRRGMDRFDGDHSDQNPGFPAPG